MENKLVQRMMQQVNEVIGSEQDRESLFSALKRYQSSSDVKGLVLDLKRVLNEPQKLELYDYVRPLIRPTHQQHYDKLTPSAPGQKLRVVRLRRRPTESLGFAVRGGFEHGIGVFVSSVEPGSQAELNGLRVGDEIVRVNGFTISEAIHEEVLNLIKGREEIELKVTNIGMLPIKQNPSDPVTWQYVDKPVKQQIKSAGNRKSVEGDKENVKLFINLRGATSLGCSIVSGPKHFPGIFIETVKPGSLGEDYGLEVGDQLIEVNGTSFLDIKHKEAIVELKGNKELNMVIRKGAGVPLLDAKKAAKPSPKASPVAQKKQVSITPESPKQIKPESAEIMCEILEEDQYAQEEKRRWEEEQARLQRVREEERVREEFKKQEIERKAEEERKKIELENRRQEEKERRRLEEMGEKEEQARREKEQEIARNLEKERLKQQEKRYKKSKKREKENEFYRRVRIHQRETEQAKQEYFVRRQQELEEIRSSGSAILAGRSGPINSMKPTLLGAVTNNPAPTQFTSSYAGDKDVRQIVIKKVDNQPLDIDLEGGVGSPLGGKIVVAEVFYGGTAYNSGEIQRGAQILSIDGTSLIDITLEEALNVLDNAERGPRDIISLEIIDSELSAFEDETTYF